MACSSRGRRSTRQNSASHRHAVYLSTGEIVFIFEGDEVESIVN